MNISVCTLGFGREAHMYNLVAGLAQSEVIPDELVVAVMQADTYTLPDTPFPVRQVMMGSTGIPLAAARNRAACEAVGELLIFLDVDCIPHPSLVGDYRAAAAVQSGVLMGEVGYLPNTAPTDALDFAAFERLAVQHSERAGPPPGQIGICTDYRCFWSLNFAMPSHDFASVGGFDETFDGYGGEDTDFGRSFVTAGVPLSWVRGAKAFHQYHPHHMPPVHHLDSVLANAHRFQQKWGEPTMEHWLRAFQLMELIKHDGEKWVKRRDPGETELALTRQQSNQPYASSASVLVQLEEAAAADATALL